EECRTVHISDVLADPDYVRSDAQKVSGYRSGLGVPLLREGTPLGVIILWRAQPRPFTDKQTELVNTFADQAVIAIENVRLFEAEQQRARELSAALEQQTATADMLKVISRSTFVLQVVLDMLVESAARLAEADMTAMVRLQGSSYIHAASYGLPPDLHDFALHTRVEPGRGTVTGRTAIEGKFVQVLDVQAEPGYALSETMKKAGARTMLGVPLLREGVPIGVFLLMRRTVRSFTDKQIDLVTTFADQAVIAIENVRLFESVEARTRELAQSLEELRAAQDRLVHTEKLASLGQLTAGIAHEIKNPLNFVNNFSAVSIELIDELREALG